MPASATPGYCDAFGNAPRNSIEGPGTVQNNMALSKTAQLGETRSLEIRATISNVFNTVQYSGVDTTYGTPNFGQVSSAGRCASSISRRASDSRNGESASRRVGKSVQDAVR